MAPKRVQRLLTTRRLEEGLWTSATGCQRLLMVAGGFTILVGCHLLSANEDFFQLRGLEVAEAERRFVEVPCQGADAARLTERHEGSLVHLQGCDVAGQNFSQDTAGLSLLYAFRGSLPPEGVTGTWFRVNLEQFSVGAGMWRPIQEVENLRYISVLARGVRVGDFRLSDPLTASMPGSIVPVVQRPDYHKRKRNHGALDARNMQAHDMMLYSGNPQWPVEGDVRVWFTVGDAGRASALAAWSGERLDLWRSPNLRGDFDPLAPPRKLGIVASGSVSATELLSKIAPFSEADVWPMRCIGFAIVWCGFSLFLFPNHVVPDLCGACCCCRSFPCAVVTTALVAGLSAFYFHNPMAATAIAATAAAVLFAVASDVNFRRMWKKWKRARLRRKSKEALLLPSASGNPDGVYSGSSFTDPGGLSRTIRMAAMATGVGIVMAGPVVRALALVDLFGDYYDAISLN